MNATEKRIAEATAALDRAEKLKALEGVGVMATALIQIGAAGQILSDVITAHKGALCIPVERELKRTAALREYFTAALAR